MSQCMDVQIIVNNSKSSTKNLKLQKFWTIREKVTIGFSTVTNKYRNRQNFVFSEKCRTIKVVPNTDQETGCGWKGIKRFCSFLIIFSSLRKLPKTDMLAFWVGILTREIPTWSIKVLCRPCMCSSTWRGACNSWNGRSGTTFTVLQFE